MRWSTSPDSLPWAAWTTQSASGSTRTGWRELSAQMAMALGGLDVLAFSGGSERTGPTFGRGRRAAGPRRRLRRRGRARRGGAGDRRRRRRAPGVLAPAVGRVGEPSPSANQWPPRRGGVPERIVFREPPANTDGRPWKTKIDLVVGDEDLVLDEAEAAWVERGAARSSLRPALLPGRRDDDRRCLHRVGSPASTASLSDSSATMPGCDTPAILDLAASKFEEECGPSLQPLSARASEPKPAQFAYGRSCWRTVTVSALEAQRVGVELEPAGLTGPLGSSHVTA